MKAHLSPLHVSRRIPANRRVRASSPAAAESASSFSFWAMRSFFLVANRRVCAEGDDTGLRSSLDVVAPMVLPPLPLPPPTPCLRLFRLSPTNLRVRFSPELLGLSDPAPCPFSSPSAACCSRRASMDRAPTVSDWCRDPEATFFLKSRRLRFSGLPPAAAADVVAATSSPSPSSRRFLISMRAQR
jgi:hypothetical protein